MNNNLIAVVEIDDIYTHELIINSLSKYGVSIITKEEEQQMLKQPFAYRNKLVQFKEYEHIDWELLSNNNNKHTSPSIYLLTNCYCIRKGLIRKAQLSFILNKYFVKNNIPHDLTFYPKTWYFELDDVENFEELLIDELYDLSDEIQSSSNGWYLLKASLANRANYIELFNSINTLHMKLEMFYNHNMDYEGSSLREWVIQKVVDPPLLINNRKFHIRTYIVIQKAIRVYLFRDMLALFSSSEYCVDNKESFITNTCHQSVVGEDSVQSLFELNEINNATKMQIYDQIKYIITELINAMLSEPIMFQLNNSSFELFGLDFLLDNTNKVYFLEANAFPDLKQTGYKLRNKIQRLFDLIVEKIVLGNMNKEQDFELIFDKKIL